jgi:hypothetical protein
MKNPPKTTITFRLSPALRAKLEAEALERGCRLSSYVERLLVGSSAEGLAAWEEERDMLLDRLKLCQLKVKLMGRAEEKRGE